MGKTEIGPNFSRSWQKKSLQLHLMCRSPHHDRLGAHPSSHCSCCQFVSSGQDGNVSFSSYAHALFGVSIYHNLSLGPQHCNQQLGCSVPADLCFIQDQPDTTAITWSQCPCTRSGFSDLVQPPFTLPSRLQPCASFEISQMLC